MLNKEFIKRCESLEIKIKKSYEETLTIEEAERLAAEFLGAQLDVGTQLRAVDLDARMKKTGVKALKAAVYMEAATKTDKKPSDVLLEATVNMSKLVVDEQTALDVAESNRDALQNYLSVFKEAHIFFRGVSRGKFE